MTLATLLHGRDRPVVHAAPDTPVRAIVALLADQRIGAVPVMDGEAVVGILSERDVIAALRTGGAEVLELPAARVMTQPPVVAAPDMPLLAALSLMTRRRFRHLPVMEGGRMVGFISIGDLVKARIDRIEAESEAMRAYISG